MYVPTTSIFPVAISVSYTTGALIILNPTPPDPVDKASVLPSLGHTYHHLNLVLGKHSHSLQVMYCVEGVEISIPYK